MGNSSLAGAVRYLKDPEGEAALRHIVHVSSEVNLSADKNFNEFYMDYMMFEEE
ncbi:MAG: hypothetical protein MRZ74_00230 [Blautia sp.]|nr:hypothetical protein [Blautia sp.]MDY5032411.1 hypothetical protein [Blautia sp.]